MGGTLWANVFSVKIKKNPMGVRHATSVFFSHSLLSRYDPQTAKHALNFEMTSGNLPW